MSGDDRRTIEELKAIYDLEPTLRDVYVEGGLDKAVVEWILRENGCRNAVVKEIETVNVPDEALERHRLDDGNKGQVIALCLELQGHLQSASQVTGIVDRDYDRLVGKSYTCPLLFFTDYACMEMYFFSDQVMTKYLHFNLRREDQVASALLQRMADVLKEAFLIRSVNEFLKLGLSWMELKGQCKVTKTAMEFDTAKFIAKYLNKGGKSGEQARFTATVDGFCQRLHADPRHQINGHDFIQLLSKHVHNLTRNKSIADEDVIERQLTTCLDFAILSEEPLFAAVVARVQ